MMRKDSAFLFFLILVFCLVTREVGASAFSNNIEESTYTSSKVCGKCHQDIYNSWKRSMHAMSLKDPIFNAAYMEAYRNTSGEAKYQCLRCHAPTTYITKDYELKLEVTQEGVTCDFCHTVKAMDLKNPSNSFIIEVGATKRGPLKDSNSTAHNVVHSNLHKSSLICAGCHQGTNGKGVHLRETYLEWRESSYSSENTECQSCHMPPVTGKVVSPKISPLKGKFIGEHSLVHSSTKKQKAVKVEIKKVRRSKNKMYVSIDVANIGSGHKIPTGMPTRKLILNVDVKTSRNQILRDSRVYEKIIVDEKGKKMVTDSDIMLNGKSVTKDNRIAPGEVRGEEFRFDVPDNLKAEVNAYVVYLYKPLLLRETEMKIEMDADKKTLRGK